MSHVGDGICDCCDGADESSSSLKQRCPDNCAAIVAAAAAAQRQLRQAYTVGSKVRAAAVAQYDKVHDETAGQLKELSNSAVVKQEENDKKKRDGTKANLLYVQHRVKRVKQESLQLAVLVSSENETNDVGGTVSGLLHGLSVEDLVRVMLHACQLAGEMILPNSNSAKTTTCVPLRLAALDIAAVWETTAPHTFRRLLEPSPLSNDATELQLAAVAKNLRHNSQKNAGDEPLWRVSVEKSDDDQKNRDMDSDGDHDFDKDDDHNWNESDSKTEEEVEVNESNREDLSNFVLSLPFSSTRSLFLEKVDDLIAAIDEKLASDREKEQTNDEEKGDETSDTKEKSQLEADHLRELRSIIDKRRKRIQQGLTHAASANVLLDAVTKSFGEKNVRLEEFLQRLTIGTLNYSKVSAAQFYEILVAVVPELSNQEGEEADPQTCPSPYATMCPPKEKSMDRSGFGFVPAPAILAAAIDFCSNKLPLLLLPVESAAAAASSWTLLCAASDAVDAESSSSSIPTEVPDGSYGYFEVHPRDDADVFNSAFANLGFGAFGNEETILTKLLEIVETTERLDKELASIDNEIKEKDDSIGGFNNPDKFGPDGELYSIRDQCCEFTQGKYTYKLCLFGAAQQRDDNGATDLGSWKGAEKIESETTTTDNSHSRVWKWENGAQCWNGPQRSATALVACGAETRILSADEPDTCRYVLEMESPLACDDAFRIQHGL